MAANEASGQQRPGVGDGDDVLKVTGPTLDFKETCDMIGFCRSGRVSVCTKHGADLNRSWCRGGTSYGALSSGEGTPQGGGGAERRKEWEQ